MPGLSNIFVSITDTVSEKPKYANLMTKSKIFFVENLRITKLSAQEAMVEY